MLDTKYYEEIIPYAFAMDNSSNRNSFIMKLIQHAYVQGSKDGMTEMYKISDDAIAATFDKTPTGRG